MAVSTFFVAIGTPAVWHEVTIVPVDNSRTPYGAVEQVGKEFRYWRVKVTENGVPTTVEGRLPIAGLLHPNPTDAVVVPPGEWQTWTLVKTADEDIITPAGTLSMKG